MRALLGLSFVASVLLVASRAAADEEPISMFTKRPTAALAVVANFGSPTGLLGVEVDRSLFSWLAGYVGFGAGGHGPQGAAGLRLRAPVTDRFGFGVGGSVSYGKFEQLCLFKETCTPMTGNVLWTNADFGADLRFHSGVALRFALGLSRDRACDGPRCRVQQPCEGSVCRRYYATDDDLGDGNYVLPYMSVAVGYAW